MTDRQLKSGVRRLHRWLGVGTALLVIVVALTGFLLQHPTWLGVDQEQALSVAAIGNKLYRGTAWGLETSTDGGQTWGEVPMLAPPLDVVRIMADPADSRRIFVLGQKVLVRSADGGRVWEEAFIDIPGSRINATYLDVAVGAGGRLGLLTDHGLLGSADDGQTWVWVNRVENAGGIDWNQMLHDLHTGRMFGSPGRLLTEVGALSLLILTISGLVIAMRRSNGRRY